MATRKQVNYALVLLQQCNYSTRFLNKEFKRLGATMRERSGDVTAWLQGLDVGRASSVIKTLLDEKDRRQRQQVTAAAAAIARTAALTVGPQLGLKTVARRAARMSPVAAKRLADAYGKESEHGTEH